jgi:hypothetical protein
MEKESLMRIFDTLKASSIVAASALLIVLGTSSLDAHARDGAKSRAVKVDRPNASYTRTTTRQRTENGRTRNDTIVGANGKTATRDAVVVNDREAGVRTRNVDYVGPNGRTASVDNTVTRTENGLTRDTVITNGQGETATRTMTLERDKEAGTATRSANYTTFDGREGSMTDVRTRTDDGYTRETTRNLPNGNVQTRSVDVSCDKDAKSCTKTVDRNGGAEQGQ